MNASNCAQTLEGNNKVSAKKISLKGIPFKPEMIGAMVQPERVHSRLFTDPEIFELEIERIFYSTWVCVGHEGEVPDSGDFRLSMIGRQPVIVTRDADNSVNVFFNACRHRGVTVCQEERGNARSFTCAYHGWTYDLKGHLTAVPYREGQAKFFQREDHALHKVPRMEIHAGFIFASVNPDVIPLDQHLGGSAKLLSDFVDLSPTGRLMVKSGVHKFRYPGNWKAQVENSVDGYHAIMTHGSFMGAVLHQRLGRDVSSMVSGSSPTQSRGLVGGHGMLDFRMVDRSSILGAKNSDLPIHLVKYQKQVQDRLGVEEGNRVLRSNGGDGYNLLVYPNLFLIGVHIRMIQPLAVNQTEVSCYPTLLEGAPDEINLARLRSHEDFYGPASFGQPDDMEMFIRQSEGLKVEALEWLLYDRGMDREQTDDDGTFSQLTDETAHRVLWAHYRRLMMRPA